jgi:hypothetical protein
MRSLLTSAKTMLHHWSRLTVHSLMRTCARARGTLIPRPAGANKLIASSHNMTARRTDSTMTIISEVSVMAGMAPCLPVHRSTTDAFAAIRHQMLEAGEVEEDGAKQAGVEVRDEEDEEIIGVKVRVIGGEEEEEEGGAVTMVTRRTGTIGNATVNTFSTSQQRGEAATAPMAVIIATGDRVLNIGSARLLQCAFSLVVMVTLEPKTLQHYCMCLC